MPVIRRQARYASEPPDIERLVEMIVNKIERACEPRFVSNPIV
ncbi:hypothetical protein [Paraburkholderia fynbosensis]|nr:hypothetical protein [Paraburkholderia fynbosensis]